MMDDTHLSYSIYRIEKKEIPTVEKILGIKVGKELKEYILDYGYISYEFIRFFGIKKKQMKQSDMILKTKWLHNNFSKTKNLIAFEEQKNGDLYLIDSNDKVFCFIADDDTLIPLDICLFDYIIKRFDQTAERIRH